MVIVDKKSTIYYWLYLYKYNYQISKNVNNVTSNDYSKYSGK